MLRSSGSPLLGALLAPWLSSLKLRSMESKIPASFHRSRSRAMYGFCSVTLMLRLALPPLSPPQEDTMVDQTPKELESYAEALHRLKSDVESEKRS